ncbi:trichohyalin-like [Pygocentrus nattereri]|uniref:trichohyalin-like n=1 Tax=Pygocentrus nattereri TaxID=42514 RepID=UPI0018913A43|nr:trichohyalin-like [Pygocentrus nattereri]
MTMKVPDEAETEASKELMSTHLEHTEDSEATDKHMDINLDGIKETPLEKHLENEMTMMMVIDAAEAEATMETMDINKDENEKKPLEKHLDKMDIKKDDPPEEDAKSTKRYTRRGTRGKGCRIIYKRDNNPQDGAKDDIRVSAHRTGAEGLRGKCREVEEERKNPPETPRPKAHPHQQQRMMERHAEKREHPQWKREQGQRTQQGLSERRSSGQRNVRKNWGDERRQVFHPRRTQEETERRPDRNDGRKAHPHQQQRMMERHEEKTEHPQWKREQGQRTQQGLSERRSSGQRDVRKNWGDERRQVFHTRRTQEETERRPDRNDGRKAHPHQQQRMMERHEEKRERPQWKKEQGQRTQGLSDRHSSGQRDVRKNWGDERRQVFHPRRVQEERRPDQNDRGVSAPKGGAEERRGQCRNVQEERKTPVENPRPKTHPHQQRKTEEHGEPREHPQQKRGQVQSTSVTPSHGP